jgi:hypothetical protein
VKNDQDAIIRSANIELEPIYSRINRFLKRRQRVLGRGRGGTAVSVDQQGRTSLQKRLLIGYKPRIRIDTVRINLYTLRDEKRRKVWHHESTNHSLSSV